MMCNYVIFIQVPFGDGVQTLCALAKAPSDHLNNLIQVLRIITAHTRCVVPA